MLPTLTIHSNVGEDATLNLALPSSFKNRAVKIILEAEEIDDELEESCDANGWPIGFFERTAGKWKGPLERGDQGEFEIRETL